MTKRRIPNIKDEKSEIPPKPLYQASDLLECKEVPDIEIWQEEGYYFNVGMKVLVLSYTEVPRKTPIYINYSTYDVYDLSSNSVWTIDQSMLEWCFEKIYDLGSSKV